MQKIKRVYHPTLNAWQDVDATNVKSWTDAGWTIARGKHIDEGESAPPKATLAPASPAPAAK